MTITATMQSRAVSKKVRKLKVYGRIIIYSSNLWRSNTASHYPEIRLMGKWLSDCGFKAGQYINIVIEQNKLVITPACSETENDTLC